jgi:uncharacterized RDD family membrane protein YckC
VLTVAENIQNYASFWRRCAASVIDGIVLSVPFYVLENSVRSHTLWTRVNAQGPNQGSVYPIIETYILLYSTLVIWAYFCGMESSPLQATLGKLAVGLYVTDLQGQRISLRRATGRLTGKLLSMATILIGYLVAGFTSKRQALHDIVAGCLVLQR